MLSRLSIADIPIQIIGFNSEGYKNPEYGMPFDNTLYAIIASPKTCHYET